MSVFEYLVAGMTFGLAVGALRRWEELGNVMRLLLVSPMVLAALYFLGAWLSAR